MNGRNAEEELTWDGVQQSAHMQVEVRVCNGITEESGPSRSIRTFEGVLLTCDEGVRDAEAEALQLLVAGELDPHEAARGRDQTRVLAPAEAIDERREAKRAVADLDVIKAALEGRLDVVILIKGELDPLSRESFSNSRKIHERREIRINFLCFPLRLFNRKNLNGYYETQQKQKMISANRLKMSKNIHIIDLF